MADSKESYKFDLGVEGLRIVLPMETKLHGTVSWNYVILIPV